MNGIARGACLACLWAGCFPFAPNKPEQPRTPAMVQRFADETSALGVAPSPPRLTDLTRTMARAVESLPRQRQAHEMGRQIDAEAQAMEPPATAADEAEHAHRSLTLALEAIEKMNKPAGASADRQRALQEAHQAVDALAPAARAAESRTALENAYRAVGSVMLLSVSGEHGAAAGAAIWARWSRASRSGSRAGAPRLSRRSCTRWPVRSRRCLRRRRRCNTWPRSCAAAPNGWRRRPRSTTRRSSKRAAVAEDAIAAVEKPQRFAALESLRTQARAAIAAVSAERPFELQRPAVQDAFRLLADALTIAAAR